MSARRFFYLLAVLAVALVAVQTQADDLNPPSWRGQPGSTFQEWTFDVPTNLAAPNNVNNPYGPPVLQTPVAPSWVPGMVLAESLTFQIPNRPELNPVKYIRIQASFQSLDGSVPSLFARITSEPSTVGSGSGQIQGPAPSHPDTWYALLDVTLRPNPYIEWITLGVNYNGIPGEDTADGVPVAGFLWDQVVIDTWCPPTPVPEPMSMTLAGLGLFGVISSRMRKR